MRGGVLRAAAAIATALVLVGTVVVPASAQQPSDPSECDASMAQSEFCRDTDPGPAQVLSGELSKTPDSGGGLGSLAKTGTEVLLLVLVGALAIAAGIAVRRAATRA